MGTFHEVLPGNLDFFHFYYIGTKEIEILNNATAFYVKSYISEWNCTSGIENLAKTFCDQTVHRVPPWGAHIDTLKVTFLFFGWFQKF